MANNYQKFYCSPQWFKLLNSGKWDSEAVKPVFRPGAIQIGDDVRDCPGMVAYLTDKHSIAISAVEYEKKNRYTFLKIQ